jgi:hypothetical protein
MAQNQGRKIYRTARGKQVDLDLLISRNELTPAVGNARVNARGDELSPQGEIIRKREDVLKDYYQASQGMKHEDAVPVRQEQEVEPAPVVTEKPKKTATSKPKAEPKPVTEEDEWIEDEDGNFIRKGG